MSLLIGGSIIGDRPYPCDSIRTTMSISLKILQQYGWQRNKNEYIINKTIFYFYTSSIKLLGFLPIIHSKKDPWNELRLIVFQLVGRFLLNKYSVPLKSKMQRPWATWPWWHLDHLRCLHQKSPSLHSRWDRWPSLNHFLICSFAQSDHCCSFCCY